MGGAIDKDHSVCILMLSVLLCLPSLLDRMGGQRIIFYVCGPGWWRMQWCLVCGGHATVHIATHQILCVPFDVTAPECRQLHGLIVCICMYTGLLLYSVCLYWACYRWMNFELWTQALTTLSNFYRHPTSLAVVKTDCPYIYKPPTHLAVAKKDSPNFYKPPTLMVVEKKTDSPNFCKPPTRQSGLSDFLHASYSLYWSQNVLTEVIQASYMLWWSKTGIYKARCASYMLCGGQNGLSDALQSF